MAGLDERDELNEPLGLRARKVRRPVPYGLLFLAAGAALAVGLGVFLVETDDHLGGEPFAVASVDRHPVAAAAPAALAAAANPGVDTAAGSSA
ncbi:MAG: hypothetical protein ABSE69_17605, partial [Roseiarcus sp.]